MRRRLARLMPLLLVASLLLQASPASAWNQVTHRQINLEAVRLFMRQQADSFMPKYVWGPITPQGYGEPLRGIAVTSSSLLVEPYQPPAWTGAPGLIHLNGYTLGIDAMPLDAWVSAGGDWADEPHLYASVRHFYDPLARWGHAYLTDQYEYHGWYDDPQIDARTWALEHPDNPFSWKEALRHYKAALELDDEGWTPGAALAPAHFKTAIELNPLSADDERRIHLALAYRGLGETMHLLGDMVQPAHVRNDSHPYDEPIESNTFAETVSAHAQKPVDEDIAPYLASAGGVLQTPGELFRQVALFVNREFYTADTIFDSEGPVIPANIKTADYLEGKRLPYESPQLDDLTLSEVSVDTWRGKVQVEKYSSKLAATEVPMAQERLSWVWFGQLLPKQVGATETFTLRPYHVPPSFANLQAEVLLPIAIHAGADLMDLFYPTLRLTAELEDLREQEHSPSVINISAAMTHLVAEDKAWSEQGLTIAYTGPARLEMTAEGKAPVVRKLHFVNGQLARIETHLGEMAEAPLVVYVEAPDTTMPAAEAFYRAEPGAELRLVIEAGSRTFASDAYQIEPEEPTVTIVAPRLVLFELREGATEAVHELSAYALPEGAYGYAWNFGDGETASHLPAKGESSTISHTYRNLKAGDVYYPTVALHDIQSGELLAEDSITIKVEGQATEPLDWDCGWLVDYAVLHRSEGPAFVAYHDAAGNAHGPWLTWRDASREVLKTAGCYYESKEHGRWTEYYENGVVMMETDYKNGKEHGLWIRYNPDGVKVSEYTRQDGRDNGPMRKWHDNGQLSSEGFYTNDEPSGIWRYYNEDGSCSSSKDWDTGESIACP
jgi:hypothetical protein